MSTPEFTSPVDLIRAIDSRLLSVADQDNAARADTGIDREIVRTSPELTLALMIRAGLHRDRNTPPDEAYLHGVHDLWASMSQSREDPITLHLEAAAREENPVVAHSDDAIDQNKGHVKFHQSPRRFRRLAQALLNRPSAA